jgi:hypothetical protein
MCKSAGTLIAVGADELIMSDFAELGPLDVQLPEKDELAKISSGLNVDEALRSLKSETFSFFHSIRDEGINAGLSTKMAAELASNLSIQFITPIVAQIDPLRVGATRRAVKIALAYGERLLERAKNLKSPNALINLIQGYPDHGFVIDYQEAGSLFKAVRKNRADEENLAKLLYHEDFLEQGDIIYKFNISERMHETDNLPETIAST